MRRPVAVLSALILATGSAGVATALTAGGAATGAMPPPCPPRQLVTVSNGNVYIGIGCTQVEIPGPVIAVPPGL